MTADDKVQLLTMLLNLVMVAGTPKAGTVCDEITAFVDDLVMRERNAAREA